MDGREPFKSPNVRKAIATRIVPVEDHFVLPGSVYLIPRRHGLELIGKLRKHRDSPIFRRTYGQGGCPQRIVGE